MVASISDVCAMNGITKQITVSIAVSNRFKLESVQELYSGIKLACKRYNVDLVGGDTTSSLKGLVISVTAIGIPAKSGYVTRSGSKNNDLVVVSGSLRRCLFRDYKFLKERNKFFWLIQTANQIFLITNIS